MRVIAIDIKWHQGLSVFACAPFLKEVGDEYGWLGGFSHSDELRFILPFAIIRKAGFGLVRFRVETIPVGQDTSVAEEKAFLNAVVDYFRSAGLDMIVPATNNTIFRTYPDGAVVAPYGTYVVDLQESEEVLWSRLHSKHRNVVRSASKKGVVIRNGLHYVDAAYQIIRETLQRSKLGIMSSRAFGKYVESLEGHVEIFVGEHNGALQGCAVIPFSDYAAYYVYGGTVREPITGAMNLLHWEAMRHFRRLGVRRYDFVGARINPEVGSKQAGLAMFKERFGGVLIQGFMWKYPLHRLKFGVYSLAVRCLRGGDIVDQEQHKRAEV
jgi:hypothetical protein